MRFFTSALSLALLAGSALAQSTVLALPAAGSALTVGSDFTVQITMGNYPENIDVVAVVIGLNPCLGSQCEPASAFMGTILYQGGYTQQTPNLYSNYTVTVPEGFPNGTASLNVINFFMVGASFEPIVDYLNETVTVVSS